MAKQKLSWVCRTEEVWKNALEAILSARSSGKLWKLTIEEYVPPITRPQNNTIHMWMGELSDATGQPMDSVKYMIKESFYPREEVLVAGKLIVRPKSTKELTIAETSDIMEQMLAEWAAYVDFTIPDPAKAR